MFSRFINQPNVQFIQNTELGTGEEKNYIAFTNSFSEYANFQSIVSGFAERKLVQKLKKKNPTLFSQ